MNRKTKLVISSKDDSPSRVNKNARVVPGNDGSDDPDFNDTEFKLRGRGLICLFPIFPNFRRQDHRFAKIESKCF